MKKSNVKMDALALLIMCSLMGSAMAGHVFSDTRSSMVGIIFGLCAVSFFFSLRAYTRAEIKQADQETTSSDTNQRA